jgi:NAD(P)-dependent dehydrogenase (short-subunit alcohol dehydrogenase family)
MTDLLTELPSVDSVRSQFDLSGRVVLITGGGSGLGRAMAWGLACQGAHVAIVDRDVAAATACAKEISVGCGTRTFAVRADVTLEEEVESTADQVLANMGPVDVLVNNAGHNIRKPLIDYTLAEFDSLHEVHVRGTFLFCRAVGRTMKERKRGNIINIASILGHVATNNVGPYAAAKAAIVQLTRVLALEFAPQGIRVNAIAPGYIDTALTRQHAPEVRNRIAQTTPLGRFGQARELIGPIVFLASDSSSFVTGSSLIVDGGWTAQ